MSVFKLNQKKYFLYSGTGNTFALIHFDKSDNVLQAEDIVNLAKSMCEKHDVDGLLVMSSSKVGATKMRIINRDGSEASMCGNGSRCAAHWAHHYAGLPESFLMESGAGMLKADVHGDTVKVRLTQPSAISVVDQSIVKGAIRETLLIDTGVPHAVTEVDKIASVNINELGPIVRYHEAFKPQGANATFFQKKEDGIICRVYERGVEAETQSCGTGSAAAAIIASHRYRLKSPVMVQVQSGDYLSIYFETNDFITYKNIDLEGKVSLLSIQGDQK